MVENRIISSWLKQTPNNNPVSMCANQKGTYMIHIVSSCANKNYKMGPNQVNNLDLITVGSCIYI